MGLKLPDPRGFVLNNPLVLRELSQRLGGGRLALGVVAATGLQGLAVLIAFTLHLTGETVWLPELDLSELVYYCWAFSLFIFVLLSAPVRAYGLFDWERSKDSLDQHVTSGSSPIVTLNGKLMIVALYGLVIAACSLPLGLLGVYLGGVEVYWVFETLAVAAAFGFMLVGFVMWGSMIEPELGVSFSVICSLSLFFMISSPIIFFAPTAAAILPVHQAHMRLADSFAASSIEPADPELFGVPVPATLFTIGLYIILGLCGYLRATIGPKPVSGPQATTFGTLITDSRKRWGQWIGNKRSRRRADLRFLYENRAAWVRDNEARLLEVHDVLSTYFILGIVLGLSWPAAGMKDNGLLTWFLLVAGAFLLGSAFRGASTREELVGSNPRAATLPHLTGSVLLLLAPCLVFTAGLLIDGSWGAGPHPDTLVLFALCTAHAVALHLLMRAASWHSPNRARAWVYAVLVIAIGWIGGPFVFFTLVESGRAGAELSWMVLLSPPATCAHAAANDWHITFSAYRNESWIRISREFEPWHAFLIPLLQIGVFATLNLLLSASARWAARRKHHKGATGATAATLLLCLMVPAHAEEEKRPDPALPTIELSVGIGGMALDHLRTPVTVIVRGGTRPWMGTLEVASEQNQRVIFREELELDPGQQRCYRRVMRRSVLSWGVNAKLRSGVLAKVELEVVGDAPGWPGHGRVLLYVDRSETIPVSALKDPGRLVHAGCRPEMLPVQRSAYTGMSAVILGRIESGHLDRAQLQALSEFVLTGGTVVLTTGARSGNIDPAVTGVLTEGLVIPPRLVGVKLPFLQSLLGDGLDAGSLKLRDLDKFETPGARSILRDGDVTLAVAMSHGHGQIVVAGFDPWADPLNGSYAAGVLLAQVAGGPRHHPSVAATARLRRMSNSTGGLVIIMLAMALVPLCCAVLPYLLARRMKKPLLTWFLAPLGALVAILATAAIAHGAGAASSLVAVDTFTTWNSPGSPGASQLRLGMASRGDGSASFKLAGRWHELEALALTGRDRWTASSTIDALPDPAGESTEVTDFPVARWSSSGGFSIDRIDVEAPLVADLRFEEGVATLSIKGLEEPLHDVCILTPLGTHFEAEPLQRADMQIRMWPLASQVAISRRAFMGTPWSDQRDVMMQHYGAECGLPPDWYQRSTLARSIDWRILARREREGMQVDSGSRLEEVEGIDLVSVPVSVQIVGDMKCHVPLHTVAVKHLSDSDAADTLLSSGNSVREVCYSMAIPLPAGGGARIGGIGFLGPATDQRQDRVTLRGYYESGLISIEVWDHVAENWRSYEETTLVRQPEIFIEGAEARALVDDCGNLSFRMNDNLGVRRWSEARILLPLSSIWLVAGEQ